MIFNSKRLATFMAISIAVTSTPIVAAKEIDKVSYFKSQNNVVKTSNGIEIENDTTTSSNLDIDNNKYYGDGFEVEFNILQKYGKRFQGEIILTNTSDKKLENWNLKFDFTSKINNIWNAQILEHKDNMCTIKNSGYNQDINPGQSVKIGFEAENEGDIIFPTRYDIVTSNKDVENGKYSVDFKVTSDWKQKFNAEISITNNTDKTIEDWSLEFDFDRNIETFWTAEIVEREGNHYVIKNRGYNANILPGQTIVLGFSGNPGDVNAEPENYNLIEISLEDERQEIVYDGSEGFRQIKPSKYEDVEKQKITLENGNTIEIEYMKNEIIFLTEIGTNYDDIKKIVQKYDGVIVGYIEVMESYQVEFLDCTYEDLQDKIELLKTETGIDSDTVMLNYYKRIQTNAYTPDDPWGVIGPDGESKLKWDEENPGGNNWGVEAIKAPSAWEYNEYMETVPVGVIDTRAFNNEDLIYKKNDYNVSQNMNDHATHVSGIIGATPNNAKGITGVAWNAELYAYEYIDRNMEPGQSTKELSNTLMKALEDDVKIINYSGGYHDTYLKDVVLGNTEWWINDSNEIIGGTLSNALKKGQEFLIVCAAGNGVTNPNSVRPIENPEAKYTSEFTMINMPEIKDRIIVVGSLKNHGNGEYSIYKTSQGGDRVDVVAPGEHILSTIKGGYGFMGGTSMATPHVTGIASMVWGLDPSLTGAEVKDIIVRSSDRDIKGTDDKKYKMVNALKAVESTIENTVGMGIVKGVVKDAASGYKIPSARIRVDESKDYTGKIDGTFDISLTAGIKHKIKIQKHGYMDVYYHNVEVDKNEEINLEAIMQLPVEYENQKGKVKGNIVNAISGDNMPNLSIKIRNGMNNYNGELLQTVNTDPSGNFITGELKNGVYTGEISGEGIIKAYFSFVCIGEFNDVGTITVTPLLNEGEMRIVLSWGENPRDLDSHLSGEGQHIYFGNKTGIGVKLDHDDTNSYGPETITINTREIPDGTYSYRVHHFAGTGNISTSEAKVEVYMENKLIKEYYPPNDMTQGNWNILTLNISNGKININ